MSEEDKPFAPAAEQNKEPILQVIGPLLADAREVLEIGSGTGQHAVYFARNLPHLRWQTSDLPEKMPGIRRWIAEAQCPNLPPPVPLDVTGTWPRQAYDAAFSANTLHVMSTPEVGDLFQGVAGVLAPGGLLLLYGPFSYGGRHTSESNARFHESLKARYAGGGIKDLDTLGDLGQECGLTLAQDFAMPVNNRVLAWQRTA